MGQRKHPYAPLKAKIFRASGSRKHVLSNRQKVWVREACLTFEHCKTSKKAGKVEISSDTGPWRLAYRQLDSLAFASWLAAAKSSI